MGHQKLRNLLAFHSFTGCDQTSSFASIGKKTAWETWAIYDEVTEVFQRLSTAWSISAVTDAIPVLDRYTVLMYDRTSTCTTVNAAHKDLFTRKGRDIACINPTADALLQHAKRATFQASHCWGKCLEVLPQLPPPSEWGWERGPTQAWEPLWTGIAKLPRTLEGVVARAREGAQDSANVFVRNFLALHSVIVGDNVTTLNIEH